MKWCNVMNMWRSDMDEEDIKSCCDGECGICPECEEIEAEE